MAAILNNIILDKLNVGFPVFLGPMCGVSDAPFREMVGKFGDNLMFSEMIASHAAIADLKQLKQKTHKESGQVTAVQLAGGDPEIMAEAAKINYDMGADMIDINFGCPVSKVVNGMSGSALMKEVDLATKIVEYVANAIPIPVTVKTRIGWDEMHKNAPDLVKRLEDVGAKMFTIHGRTRSQMFTGKADWDFIRRVKDAVNVPVIVNGDIKNFNDATEALERSGCDGVMISRGSYGKPWVVAEVTAAFKQASFEQLSMEQKRDIALEHLDKIISFYGNEKGIGFVKKHSFFYSKGMLGGSEFRSIAAMTNDFNVIREAMVELFENNINNNLAV